MSLNDTDIATFTSEIFPAGAGWRKSYALPLGFILSPLQGLPNVESVGEQEMMICRSCGAYLNMYSPPDENGVWICCICEEKNVAPVSTMTKQPNSLTSQVFEHRQGAAGNDTSSITDDGEIDPECSEKIVIVLDANLPPEEVKAVLRHLSTLKLKNLGLVIFSNLIHVYQVSLKGIASADIYSPTLHPLESGMDIGDRLYFGDWDAVQYCADVFYGTSGLGPPSNSEQPMSRHEYLKMKKYERLAKQKGAGETKFDGFDPKQTAALLHKARSNKVRTVNRKRLRCTGDAVLVASEMITASGSKSGRVYLFTNGCCNIGQEISIKSNASVGNELDPTQQQVAADNLDQLGKDAFMKGIGIDVFCIGNDVLNIQTLLSLVRSSGGYVLSYTSYHSVDFQRDFSYVCLETRMSRAVCNILDADKTMISTMNDPNRFNTLNGVVVDVRMSKYCVPRLCHGPFTVFDECQCPLPNERGAFLSSQSSAKSKNVPQRKVLSVKAMNSFVTQMQLGRFDPKLSISIILQNEFDIPEDSSVFFQFVSRFIEGSDLVTRVYTQKICTSYDTNTCLQTLDIEVTSVLLAKEAAYSATSRTDEGNLSLGQSEIEKNILRAKNNLDFTVNNITSTHGSYDGQRVIKEARLSQDLYQVLMNLYHFRRGMILGEGSQSFDDRALSRDIFLRSSVGDCILMMAPLLWRCVHESGSVEFVPAPASTLALWDESVLAIDAFDSLFVWSGRSTTEAIHDVKRTASALFLKERSKLRFPSPRIYELFEGESMCRKLTSRLAPSHGDPHEVQISHFADLSLLNESQLETLRSKFRTYNSKFDPSFIDWFLRLLKFPPKGRLLNE